MVDVPSGTLVAPSGFTGLEGPAGPTGPTAEMLYTYAPESERNMAYIYRSDGVYITLDPANREYQDFLAWLAEGNPAPEGWSGPINDPSVETC